jgi:Protein of unknown function (Porph_ging).
MKGFYLFIAIVIVDCGMLYAQNDNVYIKVTYQESYTSIFHAKKQSSDRMTLLIGKRSSDFFSEWATIRSHIQDSLFARGYKLEQVMNVIQSYPKSLQNYHILKFYPDIHTLTFSNKLAETCLFYKESIQMPHWKILQEKKNVAGYVCQRAVAHFFGRQWEAWFATDIPIQEGPWKLYGLPGLILEAKDSTNKFIFTCVSIERLKEKLSIAFPKGNYQNCSKEKYIDMERLMSQNLEEFMYRTTGNRINRVQPDGKVTPAKIKGEYNPIELLNKK